VYLRPNRTSVAIQGAEAPVGQPTRPPHELPTAGPLVCNTLNQSQFFHACRSGRGWNRHLCRL